MALKASLLFCFACFLLVATSVKSVEEDAIREHAPAKAPVHPPVKAPAHASVKPPLKAPPAHAPVKPPVHTSVKAPVPPPKKAPAPEKSHHHQPGHPPKKAPAPEKSHHHHPPQKAPAPEKSHHHHSPPPPVKIPPVHVMVPSKAPTPLEHGCVPLCQERCKTHRKKRPCMKVCTECCKKAKCVPPGTSGNLDKCKNYDYVMIHGEKYQCP